MTDVNWAKLYLDETNKPESVGLVEDKNSPECEYETFTVVDNGKTFTYTLKKWPFKPNDTSCIGAGGIDMGRRRSPIQADKEFIESMDGMIGRSVHLMTPPSEFEKQRAEDIDRRMK